MEKPTAYKRRYRGYQPHFWETQPCIHTTNSTDDEPRHFFGLASTGIGAAVLASLLKEDLLAQEPGSAIGAVDQGASTGGLPGLPHFRPKAKRVIYLFQSGAPSQMDLFDYKPTLNDFQGKELPDSVRKGQRLTGMTATVQFPVAPSSSNSLSTDGQGLVAT